MKTRLWLGIAVLLLAALACNLPGPAANNAQPTLTAAVTESETADLPTAGAAPTLTTAVTPTATPQGWVETNYKGVRFQAPPAFFSGYDPAILPAEVGEAGAAGWVGSAPETIQIKVTGYPLQNTFHEPRFMVFPLEVYAEINPAAGGISAELLKISGGGALPAKNLPFLPLWNAGQAIVARAGAVGFQNGSGIRFLTCYAQAYIPIDDTCLFYTYQGLTADQEYYVSGIFPVHLPALNTPEMKSMYEDATLNYDEDKLTAYMDKAAQLIGAARPADFTPDLDTLDAIAATLRIEPEVTLQGPQNGGVSCPGAIAQRLQPDMRARVTLTDGTPLRVRQTAGKSGAVLGQMPEGATMVVTGGPSCVDGGLWWKIQQDGAGLAGWVLEGQGADYYVEPWQ